MIDGHYLFGHPQGKKDAYLKKTDALTLQQYRVVLRPKTDTDKPIPPPSRSPGPFPLELPEPTA